MILGSKRDFALKSLQSYVNIISSNILSKIVSNTTCSLFPYFVLGPTILVKFRQKLVDIFTVLLG